MSEEDFDGETILLEELVKLFNSNYRVADVLLHDLLTQNKHVGVNRALTRVSATSLSRINHDLAELIKRCLIWEFNDETDNV